MSALKLEVEIDTSKAKKGLQSLAKETSQSLSMQQRGRQEKWHQADKSRIAQQNKVSKDNLKLEGGLLKSLGSLGIAATAVINTFQIFNKEVNEAAAEFEALQKEIEGLESSIVMFEKSINAANLKLEKDPNDEHAKKSKDRSERALKALDERWNKAEEEASDAEDRLSLAKAKRDKALQSSFGNIWGGIKDKGASMISGGLNRIGLGAIAGTAGTAAVGTIGLLGAGAVAGATGWYKGTKAKIAEGSKAQGSIEKMNVSLGTLSKNFTGVTDVSKLTDEIMLLGVNGVNSVEDLTSAATTLMMAMNGNQQAVSDWLPIIDDLAAATGMSGDNIAQMIARIGETEYVESRVFNTLATRGIPIYEKLAKVMGVTTEEAKKMAKASEVSSATAKKALEELGKAVKGTSANLSSMTMEGAQASFTASGELEHAGWARGYNQRRIEQLNELTAEQLENAQNALYQVNSEGAGRMVGAVENMWQSVVEWFDGALEEMLMIPADWFGYNTEAMYYNMQTQLGKSVQLHNNARVMNNETKQEDIDNMDKSLGEQWKRLQALYTLPDMSDAAKKTIAEMMNTLHEERTRLRSLSGVQQWQIEHDAEIERQQNNRNEYARMVADNNYETQKASRNLTDIINAFTQVVQSQGFASIEAFYQNLNQLNQEYAAGTISENRKADWEKYMQMAKDYTNDYNGVIENNKKHLEEEARLREEEARLREELIEEEARAHKELIEKQRNAVREDLQARIISGEYSRVGQLKELEQRWAIDKMESLTQEEKDNTYDKWLKNERERSLLQIAASSGNKTAEAELGLSDKWQQLNEYVGLTDDERAGGIHGIVDEQLKKLAKETLKGVFLGFDSQTGEAIYGEKQGPKEATTGYISNVWGASCRTFMKFEKDYSKQQYDELKKNTAVNQKTAESVRALAERFTVAAQ